MPSRVDGQRFRCSSYYGRKIAEGKTPKKRRGPSSGASATPSCAADVAAAAGFASVTDRHVEDVGVASAESG